MGNRFFGLVPFISTLAFGVTTVVPAAAFCWSPSFNNRPPEPPGTFGKPDVPYCLSSYRFSGEHTCSTWEVDSYKREVSDYIDKLNAYLAEASDFARQANRFVSEAESYAKCEADEVLSQHE